MKLKFKTQAVKELDASLRVTPLQYTIQHGEQAAAVTYDGIKAGNAFELKVTETETNRVSIHSGVKYDLIGKLAEGTQLTRRTVTEILKGLNTAVFAQFKTNPESFIAEAIRLINEQKATVIHSSRSLRRKRHVPPSLKAGSLPSAARR